RAPAEIPLTRRRLSPPALCRSSACAACRQGPDSEPENVRKAASESPPPGVRPSSIALPRTHPDPHQELPGDGAAEAWAPGGDAPAGSLEFGPQPLLDTQHFG